MLSDSLALIYPSIQSAIRRELKPIQSQFEKWLKEHRNFPKEM
ncbi:MAG: hypothetical protein ACOC4M_00385 [Promethearchaeia archaeon]